MQRIAIAGFAGLLATVGGYAACPTETECTLEARPSVIVQTMERHADGSLTPTKADAVTYVVNPHPSVEAPRNLPEAADATEVAECSDADCTEWIAGREQPGEFTVTAEVCGKKFTDVALVEMTDDDCHVNTETLVMEVDRSMCAEKGRGDNNTLAATGPTCTLELRPSVIVQTFRQVDDMVIPTKPDKLVWSYSAGPRKTQEATCADDECTIFYGPWEESGSFVFEATYCGTTLERAVTVERDACHVETENLLITFDSFAESCLDNQPDLPPIKPPTTRPDGPDGFTQPNKPPPRPPVPPNHNLDGACVESAMRAPAFVARTFKQVDDMLIPVRAESLTFTTEHNADDTWKAECMDDGCSQWKGANRGASHYIATAKVCGVDTEITFEVEAAADGCGVITEFPYIAVDTRGCITAEPQPEGEPWKPPHITAPPPAVPDDRPISP
jgi:hypothetical protein